MSDKQAGQESQRRKPSTNKNIKKLRTISMVCGLTSGWQQLIQENEKKQASEPSGWAPSFAGGPAKEPRKTWVPKKPPTEAPPNHVIGSGGALENPTPHKDTQDASKTEAVKSSAEPPVESCIKVRQGVEMVTSGVGEKSVGIGLLTEKIKKECLPSDEEIDRLLENKMSPTLRRKCSNMVSSLTESWKQAEEDQKLRKEGEESSEVKTNGGGDGGKEDSGQPKAEKDILDIEDAQTHSTSSVKEDNEEDSESEVKIKRSTVSTYKKEAEDASKINALSKKYSAVGNLKSRWQNWASEHTVTQKLNPFSEYFDYDYSMSLRLHKGQEGYGRPKEGTQTAERAKRAEKHIHGEISDMCYVIRTMADRDPDGKTRVTFGQLFDRYVRISDKVVGILMRARKHGKVAFEGEMLWQGQDDGVIITLLV